MNKTLKALLSKYGTEKVIARILEQLRIIATSEDEEVKDAVKELIASSGCDTEYIYSLCEYTNLVTPVLIVLLAMVAKEGSLLWGIVLLLLYSIGHSFLVMIAGTSVGFVHKLSASEKYGGASKILRIIMGSFITLIAFYMFYLGF